MSGVRAWRDDRGGSDVVSMIVLVPLALGVVLLMVYFGRQGRAAESVTHASSAAARAASMEANIDDARAAAFSAAQVTLDGEDASCSGGPQIAVDASGWEPGGVVAVTVTCTAEGIGVLDASARTLTATSRATIDQFIAESG